MIRDLGLADPAVWRSAAKALAYIVIVGTASAIIGAAVIVSTGGGVQP